MADKVAKRTVKVYIDGKEVEASVGMINKQVRKLQNEMKNLTIGTDEYNQKVKEIRQLNGILEEHRRKLKGVGEEVGGLKGMFANLKGQWTKFTGWLGVSVAGITRHGVFSGGRRIARTRLPRLLASADWFVMALPSTTGTDGFLSAAMMAKLPRRCVVVNVGRGNAVDERALCSALKTRRLAGAYLDVRRHEPSATVLEVPGYVPELAELPNCVVMPHAAAFSPRYIRRCFDELNAEGLLRV